MFLLLTRHYKVWNNARPYFSRCFLRKCSLFNIPLSVHSIVRILCRDQTLICSDYITSDYSICYRTTFLRPAS
nr:MAG TPA: hypothetical protein [Bacteriophage sp.]